MMSLLGFVIALGILVTVHEWGHYRVAVACRIRVLRFSIGFGQPLVRWVRRQRHLDTDIEFVIGAIPLGGYVKLLDTREEDVPADEHARAFDRQPLRARAAVVMAGPLANWLLAVALYAAAFMLGSLQTVPSLSLPAAQSPAALAGVHAGEVVRAMGLDSQDMQEVASVEEVRAWLMLHAGSPAFYLQLDDGSGRHARLVRLDVAEDQLQTASPTQADALGLVMPQVAPVLREVIASGAADRAGLLRGDRVLSIDGQPVSDAARLKRMVRASGETGQALPQTWLIARGTEQLELEVTLDVVSEAGHAMGRIGAFLGEPPATVWVSDGAWEAITKAWSTTWGMAALTIQTFANMVAGAVSWDNLGGPVAIAEMAGQSLQVGLHAFLVYLALLSVSLAVFNLLPIPALDGGHLLYYLYEFLVGKAPAPSWVSLFQRAGFLALMALMAVALFNDFQRLGL